MDKTSSKRKRDDKKSDHENDREDRRKEEGKNVEEGGNKGNVEEGLSIEEMNRLRIQLGLKPLYIETAPKEDEGNKMQEEEEDLKRTLQIQETLDNMKKQREYDKAVKGNTIAQEIEEESTSSWIEKMKRKALEREAMFEHEDEELEQQVGREDEKFRVFHDMQDINEGEEIVLTLKDQNVLEDDEDEEIALVNDSITTKEKDRRNKELKKKKPVYNPYDRENRSILPQYDEEKGPESFVIDTTQQEEEERQKKIRESLRMEQQKMQVKVASSSSSNTSGSKIATDFYNEEEMNQLFSKKKKRNNRKKQSSNNSSSVNNSDNNNDDNKINKNVINSLDGKSKRNQVLEMLKRQKQEERQNEIKEEKMKEEMGKQDMVDEEDKMDLKRDIDVQHKEKDNLRDKERRYQRAVKKVLSKASTETIDEDLNDDLYETLSKSRKRKNIEQIRLESSNVASSVKNVAEAIQQRKNKMKERKKEMKYKEQGLTFTTTSEFVKGLEVEDFPEVKIKKEDPSDEPIYSNTHNKPVTIKKEFPEENTSSSSGKDDKMKDEGEEDEEDDDEDDNDEGIGSMLNMLKSQNVKDKDSFMVASRSSDPTYIKQEVFTYNDERIDLRKFDEFGRLMTPKEAFRDLSHKFHGKGSGKNKSEKRLRKYKQQLMVNKAQSFESKEKALDNVLDYQKKTGKAYVQLTMGSQAMQELTKQTSEQLGKELQENLPKKKKNKK